MKPDGTVLRADVYRPSAEGCYPVIMTHGPYAKGLAFQTGFAGMWKPLSAKYPRRRRRLVQPVSELGDGRPGEVGA